MRQFYSTKGLGVESANNLVYIRIVEASLIVNNSDHITANEIPIDCYVPVKKQYLILDQHEHATTIAFM